MKRLLVLLIFLSSSSLAETYVCYHELSRWDGRSGEIETFTFQRIGNSFLDRFGDKIQISHETQSDLILTSISEYSPSISVVFIKKKSKEWGFKFLDMDSFRRHPPDPFTYGKCTFVK